MANIFERLAAGALEKSDYDDWNQAVGSVPPDRFHQAAHQSLRELPPEEYYVHTQPGVSGTDPLGRLPQQQRTGIIQSLLGVLTGSGLGASEIQRDANLQTLDPNRMSSQNLAGLLQWTHRNDPNALSQVATRYRNQPDILHSILGNKALMGLALGLGAKILTDQMQSRGQMPGHNTNPRASM